MSRFFRCHFKLYGEKDNTKIKVDIFSDELTSKRQQENFLVRETDSTEDKIRNEIITTLYYNIGEKGTWKGEGTTACFNLKGKYGDIECCAEKSLNYKLPGESTLSHQNDTLITDRNIEQIVNIEIKHKSAVTDQFKCRSYDMINYKNTFDSKLLGIMIFVKSTQGISIEQAKKICYSFEMFLGVPSVSRDDPNVWDELIEHIEIFFRKRKIKLNQHGIIIFNTFLHSPY